MVAPEISPGQGQQTDRQAGMFLSPRARALAEKTGADASRAVPTGANDRIMEADIQKVITDGYLVTRAVSGSYAHVLGTGIGGRITIQDVSRSGYDGQTASLQPTEGTQSTLHSTFDATDVLNFLKTYMAASSSKNANDFTIADVVTYAASRVFRGNSANAIIVSDLSGMGMEMHTPILNEPQTGLLCFYNLTERLKGGKAYPAIGLSLTYDNRKLNGTYASGLMNSLIRFLEIFSINFALGENLL